MGTQYERLEAWQRTDFVIEATSHCRNGKLPRWSFPIQGVGGNARQGMIGTNTQGCGLYFYASPTGHLSVHAQLVAPELLLLSDSLSRQQANDKVMMLLKSVNWNEVKLTAKRVAPRFELYAVT